MPGITQVALAESLPTTSKIRYWCEDESRFGLKTIERTKITAKGVQPVGVSQKSSRSMKSSNYLDVGKRSRILLNYSRTYKKALLYLYLFDTCSLTF